MQATNGTEASAPTQHIAMSTATLEAARIAAFAKVKEVCTKYNIASAPASRIYVAVIGQFKTGKSSLINSLLGEHILPVGVIPVTSVITRLQYSKDKNAIAHFASGSAVFEIGDLDSFVSESKNPSNRKGVIAVDIFTPTLKEFPNLRLVDTPGIGSVLASHQETTKQWMTEVGVAIFAVSGKTIF